MQEKKNSLLIPGAIIFAGLFIAGGIYFSAKKNEPVQSQQQVAQTGTIKPVTSADHILGDPNAPIVIVEYSDPSCPYCKLFEQTMETVMNTYGKDGTVAWVYRDFPIVQLHPNAEHEALALECASSLGGNTAFWNYQKEWYNVFPLQGATDRDTASDTAQLTQVATDVGLNATQFTSCLSSGTTTSIVQADFQDAVNAGAQGTPFSVLVLKTALSSTAQTTIQNYIAANGLGQYVTISADNKQVTFSGALPIDAMTTIIDAAK